jgi:hypothetical protein
MRHLLVLAMSIWALAAAADAAELAIVMAIDVSTSVTADSYILQREGIARAFKDPRLIDAISAAPGGIEALVLEWSDPESIAVAVPWTHIADKRSAAAFAASVHAAARNSGGLTAIGQALAAAAAQFERLPQPAARRIIDISGDGIANIGAPPRAIRDRLVKAGITINGLAIVTEQPWLAEYYRHNVIGGTGAFVLAAQDFLSFAEAMLRKLVTEIAGAGAPVSRAQIQ